METSKLLSSSVLLALVLVAACSKGASSPTLPTCALKVTLEPAPLLFLGRTTQLHASVTADAQSNCSAPASIPSQLTWTSSQPAIVQVTSPGDTTATATAKAVGSAIVRASLKTQASIADSIEVDVGSQASVVPRAQR